MNFKKPLAVGAAATVVGVTGLAGLGVAHAAANTSGDTADKTSIVDKIASKFNLNKSDVQAVFDEDRAAHEAEMKANQEERLTQAVSDGKLTQAQADHIKSAQAEIESLRGNSAPQDQSSETRDAIRAKMDELRKWANDNNIDMQYVMGGRGHGMGGPGGPEMNGMR